VAKHKNIFLLSLYLVVLNLGCTSKKIQPCPGPCPITRPGSKKQSSLPNQLLPAAPIPVVQDPQIRSLAQPVVPKEPDKPEIEWLNDAKTLEITQSNVDLNGYRVSLRYTYTLGEYDHGVPNIRPEVEMRFNYPNEVSVPLWYVIISDLDIDNRADDLGGEARRAPFVAEPFLYRRGEAGTEKIFASADALLKRFRKELRVDRLVKNGPDVNGSRTNPFPKKN